MDAGFSQLVWLLRDSPATRLVRSVLGRKNLPLPPGEGWGEGATSPLLIFPNFDILECKK